MRRHRSASAVGAALVVAFAPAPAVSAEALRVVAEPATLVLGTGAAAEILVEGATGDAPVLSTSAGELREVRALGDGRFAAEYVPPADAYPQVAIVSAVAGDGWGWIAIPLAGRGLAVARSAPGAAVRVTIGDATFGPVRANATGEASVPVVVPAGVAYAYDRGEPLPLNVPPTRHVHAVLGRSAAAAHVEQAIPFRVFSVTPAGAARPLAPVAVDVAVGAVEDLSEVAPGELAGMWRLPPGLPGTVALTARLDDEPELPSVATLARWAPPPPLVEERAPVAIVPPPPPPPAPERTPATRWLAVAPRAGLAAARGGILAATLGAEVLLRPGLLEDQLAVALEAGQFVRDRTDEVAVGAQRVAVRGRVRYLPVLAMLRLDHATGPRGVAWAAAGGGVAHVRSEVSAGTVAAPAESGVVPALRAAVGWGLRAGRVTPFAEAALGWHGNPRFDGLRGSLAVLLVSIGCRYDAR